MMFSFPRDDETAALLRDATAFADAKRWDEAIAALYAAHKRMGSSPVSYPIETWLKLPLYLQRAGRFEESVRMFDQIDAETPNRVGRFMEHQPPQVRRESISYQRKAIAKKKALAAKREASQIRKGDCVKTSQERKTT